MQMLNTYGGGTLKPVTGHVGARHHLDGDFKGRIVNSFHTYSIDNLSDSYLVLARSEDGEIEAIRHRTLPWDGWMWHPEREVDFLSAMDMKQFSFLVNDGK
ncbi:putative glutamine amidotransferase class-I [Micavibrio aeruginosavorus ARL-13]|uniref:Putative glutamine amidotransferase class-I n=2 Tax=Micavibrio aeruginosavorus TaxID=349221 RepID=G2KLW4_MICAA|nr:putative glutamine amidotransferase class-I [Micavibrio aeruginosavorus ARL-13]